MAKCSEAVLSDEYKGFGVANRGEEEKIKSDLGGAACLRRVSDDLVFVYFYYPKELQGGREYAFGTMQKCYGLMSEQELAASGVLLLRESPVANLYGSGTLIGFVDTGINFAEDAFLFSDRTTRLVALWDQTVGGAAEDDFAFYGTVYSQEELNAALQAPNPYEIVPSRDEIGHGSALVRTAAGSTGRGGDLAEYGGVAPLARLAMVKLKQAKPYLRQFYQIPDTAVCYAEEDIIYGVEWLRSIAERENLPLVLCIALGSNQGNHTGRTVLSRYLNSIAQIPGVCAVVAGGNEGGSGHHYFGKVTKGNYEDVELVVGEGESGFCAELWAVQPDIFTIEITSPAGELIPKIPGRSAYTRRYPLYFEGGSVEIQSNLFDQKTGLQGIWIRFAGVAAGIWRIRVYGEGDFSGEFHMWLPIQPFLKGQTRFLSSNPYTQICDPGAADEVLTFTAYDVVSGALNLASSFGYTADGRIKPDVAAPQGEAGIAGTGLAAAFAGGCAALVFEAAARRAGYFIIDTQVVKRLFITTAEKDRMEYPNREWGYGKLDLYSAFVRSPGRQ